MIDSVHKRSLIFTIGLRLGFIPRGGAITDECLKKDYFIKDESGEAQLFTIGFPSVSIHFLNT